MKLHYKGKYDLNPDSLPGDPHKPNAVQFKEPQDTKTFSKIINIFCLCITVLPMVIVYLRDRQLFSDFQPLLGVLLSLAILFPHELLHAVCFRGDVYLYTNWAQGMLFVVGTETMSKQRFVFMSLLPNLIFGFIPYLLWLLVWKDLNVLAVWGAFSIGMGAGDYYNVFNAMTQMPKGARTYLHKFNSFWYMPEEE